MKKYNEITVWEDSPKGPQYLVRLTEEKDIFISFREEDFNGVAYLGQSLNILKLDGHLRSNYGLHDSLVNITEVESSLVEMSRDMWKRKVEAWEVK